MGVPGNRERPEQRVLVPDVDRVEANIGPGHAVLDRRLVRLGPNEDLENVDLDRGAVEIDGADERRVGAVG